MLNEHMPINSPQTRESQPYEEVLGIFLTVPNLFTEYKNSLHAEMFTDLSWLYHKMLEVETEEGLTFKGLASRCDLPEIKELHELRKTFITERRLSTLIKHMKDEQLLFQIRSLAKGTLEETESADPNEILRKLQKQSFDLFTTDSENMQNPDKDVDDWAAYMMEILETPAKAFGLMTGISELDAVTTGFHRQDFSVVGARTSMGKTAFMLEMVLRLNAAGYKCAVFSLEMIKRQMYNRMMANMLQVSLESFRTGRLHAIQYEDMNKRKSELKTIYVDDTRGINADYIGDVCRRLKRTQGLDFVVVDYIQDVKEQGETNDNQGSAIGRICRKLRKAAQDCDCHVMGLSQVSRAVEERQDKRPTNSDLSGSTGIETSADVIALLYRDDYYNPNTEKKNVMEVNFTKQRNGRLGKVELMYVKEHQRIIPLDKR